MKTTRPVFESFDAFVGFLKSEMINEADITDWKGILSNLKNFLDADATKAFTSARDSFNKAPTYQNSKMKKNTNKILSWILTGLDDSIDSNIENNQDPKNLQITENTTTEVKTITYGPLINGKIKVSNHGGFLSANDGAIRDLAGEKIDEQEWVDINDWVTKTNLNNLASGKIDPDAIDLDKKHGKWRYSDNNKNKVAYSGPYNQYYISSIAAGISMADFGTGDSPGKILAGLNFENFKISSAKEKNAKNTVILYGIGTITQGGGGEISDVVTKKEITTEVVPGTVKEYETSITGDDKMFAQGKINIENKAGIDKAINAALSPLAGAPESIVITGGASFEGGLDTNKKLVVERAKAVQVYMEGLYPALKGKITVAETDFSKIQTKDDPAEYEKYRKVYLKIKGVLQSNAYSYEKEKTYSVDAPINADSVEIIQYAISFEYTIPNFKEES